jgi:integrase/recombinase XerD
MFKIIAYDSHTLAERTPPPAIPEQADDDNLVSLWLGLFASPSTRDLYARTVRQFRAAARKPLRLVSVADLQAWLQSQPHLSASTRNVRMTALKSIYRFGMEIGYLSFNPTVPLRGVPMKQTRAERIMTEDEVQALLQAPISARNRAFLYLLYAAGLRVSESVSLRWRDVVARDNGTVQITVFGKGGKTRAILVPETAAALLQRVSEPQPDHFIFHNPQDPTKPLWRSQAHRIVKAAAKVAGINPAVSAHWMRHAHASHALDHGASLVLVQKTLGHSDVKTTSMYLHVRPGESSGLHLRFPELSSEAV